MRTSKSTVPAYDRNISLSARPGSSWSSFRFSKATKCLVGKLKSGGKVQIELTPQQLDSFLAVPVRLRGSAIASLSKAYAYKAVWS